MLEILEMTGYALHKESHSCTEIIWASRALMFSHSKFNLLPALGDTKPANILHLTLSIQFKNSLLQLPWTHMLHNNSQRAYSSSTTINSFGASSWKKGLGTYHSEGIGGDVCIAEAPGIIMSQATKSGGLFFAGYYIDTHTNLILCIWIRIIHVIACKEHHKVY